MNSDPFSKKLGYVFSTPALLERALTHRSFSSFHNERLEFLGDALLNCIITQELYAKFPDLPEGSLSRARANLVNKQALCKLAQQLELGSHVHVGQGESKSGGKARPSILANALEAVFAAVYLDGGFEHVNRVIRNLFVPLMEQIDPNSPEKDSKTLLQEYLQSRKISVPKYRVVATSGQAHQQHFEVECVIPEMDVRSTGNGSSRRSAEQDAAKSAYQKIFQS